jgi:SAM-dependent methyltransferase
VGDVVDRAVRAGLLGYGLDISERAIRSACSLVPDGQFVTGDGERLPYPCSFFDYVLNVGSLEHFIDPAVGVQEMRRVLKYDGRALLLLPNTFGLTWNVLHVWKTGRVAEDEQPIQRYGTRASWRHLLEQNGLRVQKVIKYEQEVPYTVKDWVWYLRRPKRLLNLAIAPLIPVNLGKALVFLCYKDV